MAECPRAIKDNVCKSCAEANPAFPIWAPEMRVCRPCTDADGGPFWDPATQRCYSVCPDTAPKATAERTCRKCDELQDKGHFWDGTDCVSACPFTWDANGVCRTCAEMDSTKPFWSVKECSDQCPYRWSVDEKDQQCVRDCGDSINMTVDDHGLAYTKCTGEQECHGFYQWDTRYHGDVCVSLSACGTVSKGYAYAYGEERRCLTAYPSPESTFDVKDGVYSCRAGTYLTTGRASTKCVTKKECSKIGYVINGAECKTSGVCPMYLYEDETGKECIDEAACAAMGLLAFVNDNGLRRCIPVARCLDFGGYLLTTDQGTTCVNASSCFGLGRYAYASIHECSAQKPSSEGYFDEKQKAKYIYACSSEHPYFDANEENAKCSSITECVADGRLEYVSDDKK